MEDLARCVWTSAQETVRRDHLQNILTHFYAKLKANLGKDPPFTFDLLMKAWDRLTKYGMLGGIGPILILTKVDPDISGDAEKIKELFGRARNMMVDALPYLEIEKK